MTPRDELLFMQGYLLGVAVIAQQHNKHIALIDQRVHRIESKLEPALRVLRRLVPAGQRDGHKVYRIAGR
jgi:hypothetical protein